MDPYQNEILSELWLMGKPLPNRRKIRYSFAPFLTSGATKRNCWNTWMDSLCNKSCNLFCSRMWLQAPQDLLVESASTTLQPSPTMTLSSPSSGSCAPRRSVTSTSSRRKKWSPAWWKEKVMTGESLTVVILAFLVMVLYRWWNKSTEYSYFSLITVGQLTLWNLCIYLQPSTL